MSDKLLTRVMPVLFVVVVVLMLIPATSVPILRFLAGWYTGQEH